MENITELEQMFSDISQDIKGKFISLFLDIIELKLFDINFFDKDNISKEQLNIIIDFTINKNSVKLFKGDLSTNFRSIP